MNELLNILQYELKINSSLSGKVAILILRLEKVRFLKYLILPFRIMILNFWFNTEIPKSVTIKRGLRIPHPYGIIIHSSCSIGENCTIFQGVTLGLNEFKSSKGPILEDNVYIGSKASLIGEILIGKNCLIAAHSLITKDMIENQFGHGQNTFQDKVDR